MSRTTTQIESSIDNSETIKLMEYLKDYLTKITNLNTDKLNTLLQDIYNKVNGLTTIIGHLGRPLEPAATDPDIATTEEYSWYFNTTTKAFKMLHNGAWIVIATLTGTVDLSEYLKTTDADAKFEPRNYDFSNTETPLTYNLTNAKRFQIISKPAGADNTPIGLTNKIVIKVATTDPSELPQDADQITYGSDLLWVVKSNGDIVTWDEIKDNVNAKKIMVIKHLSNGNWELVRWEVSNEKKYASIDLSNSTAFIFYKGQMIDFDEVKTGTKFEDTSLFAKHLIKEGYAVVGGTGGTETTGEVKAHTHSIQIGSGYDSPQTASARGDRHTSTQTGSTGGSANLAAGIKLLKVVYVAKKDITYQEMV